MEQEVIKSEKSISDQVRSEGECLYARDHSALAIEPPVRMKQDISVGLSVPYAACDFHLLHVWEHEGRLIVTSRLDYLVGTGGIGSHQPTHFHKKISVNVSKEMPVEHYLVTNMNPDNIEWTPLAGYAPSFLKQEAELRTDIIENGTCLYENDISDSDLRIKTFIADAQVALRLRLFFLNRKAESFFKDVVPTEAFIKEIIGSRILRDALTKGEHSLEERRYILLAGEVQHLIEDAFAKVPLSYDEYNDLSDRFGLSTVKQERLSDLFKKFDTVYKKSDSHNGLTFFKTAAIATLGVAATALATYALANRN